MALGIEVGLGPDHIVLDGDPAPLHTQKLAHFYFGQMAGCIRMPSGMEVGLTPGDFVFDVYPATPRKTTHPPYPIFGPCLLWPNGWMDEDATLYGSRPRQRRYCVRWGRNSPLPKSGQSPLPNFRPICIVAKQLDGSR